MSNQSFIKTQIEKQFQANALAHALLFYGAESPNVFVNELAEIFLKSRIQEDFHPDFMKLSGDETIKVDEIREAQTFLLETPHQSECRILLLEDVDRMTGQAANAFLKILEEPPKSRFILMSTRKLSKLPRTILSRCQRFYLSDLTEYSESALPLIYEQFARLDKTTLSKLVTQFEKKTEWADLDALQNLVLYLIKSKHGICMNFDNSQLTQDLQALALELDLKQLFSFYEHIVSQKRTGVVRGDLLAMDWYQSTLDDDGRRTR